MKLHYLATMVLAMTCTMSSCSDDDKDEPQLPAEEETNLSGTAISIPASVVDGVRVKDNGSGLAITYNADGTIDNANLYGTTYRFEYADSREATPTGRKLVRITASYTDGDEQEKWEATNFSFNTDGFIASYLEKSEERSGSNGDYDKTVIHATCDYTAAGRIKSIGLVADFTQCEDGQTHTYHESTSVSYTYNGGDLASSSVSDGEMTNRLTYGYDLASTNTYNIVTPQLAYGMANYSPIAYIFAVSGYLGNASANLPTSFTQDYIDHEDPEDSSSESFGISYTFDSANRIKSIICDADGYTYTTNMTYFVQE